MLVYANNFTLIGSKIPVRDGTDYPGGDSSTAAFGSIVGWLRHKTGRRFLIPEILSGGEFQQGIYQVRTYAADKREPKLYSVLLTHRDNEIYGRFWSTEIGVRLGADSTFISILLETQDISTRITEMPVTTRPGLVNSLARKAEFTADTTGLKIRNLFNPDECYQAFDAEIKNKKRDYPLVLVSCGDGQPLVDPEALQRQLFGLAQLIYVDESCDSWKMANILGNNYSAWGGAVNIIFPYVAHKGFCYTSLIRRPELEELRQESEDSQEGDKRLLYEILARVTHSTNWLKRRQHFSPADVRAKRQKDYLLYLREQIEQGQNNTEMLEQLLADADRELKEQKETSDQLLETADKERKEAENKVQQLRYKPVPKAAAEKRNVDITDAVLALSGQKELTPRLCLELAAQQSGNIVLLESALKSADKAADYCNSQNLLAALYKLGGEFLTAYLAGGANQAKNIFGIDTYAAKESEQTMNNPKCKTARIFSYKGKNVTMWQHLGWGVANNTHESLRLYFHIDQEDKKIVIGHCGEHLPTIKSSSV